MKSSNTACNPNWPVAACVKKLQKFGHQEEWRCSQIQQALCLKHTDALRRQPQASARHHWASRASVADMALLTWFLLWLPAYEESCCLVFFPLRVAFDSSEPESADGLGSRVSVCISQWSSCWEGCKSAKLCFHLHEVHIYSPRNLELLSKTLLWLSDTQLYNSIQNLIKQHESLLVALQKSSGFAGIIWGIY